MRDLTDRARHLFERWTGRSATNGVDSATATSAASFVEEHLQPRHNLRLGKSLAFAINDESVEMAAVYRWPHRIRLLGIDKVYFPGDAVTREARTSFAVDVIEEFLRTYGGRRCYVSLAVSGPETSFRTFLMPRLKRKQMASAIAFEIEKQLPFPIADCYHDFREISRINRDDISDVKISLQAATANLVDERLEPFRQLGYDVQHVYNAPDAIGQLLKYLPDYEPSVNYALINIERTRSQIAYYRGANLEFYHYCSLGSSQLSNAADDTEISRFTDQLAEEIQNSLDFYTGQFSTRATHQVYVYGDMAFVEELVCSLSRRFGFEFSRFPSEKLSFLDGDQLREELSVSVCLPTLAAAVCDSKIANLLPEPDQAALKEKTVDRLAPIFLSALAIVLTTNWVSHYSLSAATDSYLADLKHNIESISRSSVFTDYSHLKQQVEIDRSYLNKVQERPSYLGLNLKELSRLTPETVQLVELDINARQPTQNLLLRGVIRSADTPPEIILAEFVETLAKSAFYHEVDIYRHHKKTVDNRSELEFTLRLTAAA